MPREPDWVVEIPRCVPLRNSQKTGGGLSERDVFISSHPRCVAHFRHERVVAMFRGGSISVLGFAEHHDTVDMPRGPEVRVDGVPTKYSLPTLSGIRW